MTSSLFPRCHRPPPGTGTGTGAGAGKGALGGREGRARRCPEGAEHGPAAAGGGSGSAARPGEVGTAAARERVGGERWGVAGAPRGRGRGSRGARRCRLLRWRSPASFEQFGLRLSRRRGTRVDADGAARVVGVAPGFSLRAGILGLGEPPLLPPQRGDWGQLRAAMPRRDPRGAEPRDRPAPGAAPSAGPGESRAGRGRGPSRPSRPVGSAADAPLTL